VEAMRRNILFVILLRTLYL